MELFHILNRGVDKRNIFLDKQDYWRFVHNLWEFNSAEQVLHVGRRIRPMVDFVSRPSRKKLVIHAWCLMKNHYHLLFSERADGGITQFIRKLNIGYAKYFNERYKRVGTLFQGRTKKILIGRDAHFLHILNYIHLNPLNYLAGAKSWRAGKIGDTNFALAYLAKYRWSSYLDYTNEANVPSILNQNFFREVFPDYRNTLKKYLRDMEYDERKIKPLLLE